MQASNISVTQSPVAPALPGSTGAQGSAASWQAALNAAQAPEEQAGQSEDAASQNTVSQDTRSESAPAAQTQQSEAESAQGGVAAQSAQSEPSTVKSQTDAAANTGTAQDGAAATAKHVQQRHEVIAAAASAQVETQAKPQDKTREKEQNGAVAVSAVQQAQPEQAAAAPKAPVQAGGGSVPEAAKSAAQPARAAASSDTPVAEAAAQDSANDTQAIAAPADVKSSSRTAHAAQGQAQPGMVELAAAAPAAVVAPAPMAQQPAQNATAKVPVDTTASKMVKASAGTGSAAVSIPGNKSGVTQQALQTMQPISTSDDNNKTPGAQTGFAVTTVHAVVNAQATAASSASTEVAVSSAVLPVSTNASAAGLAATITAMHQSGQGGATFRLDPPGLGSLAVHVALGQQGQVNVLFVPSTQAAGTALQSGLPGLGQALAQSGLTLGQAQVGGQSGQNAGQGGQQPQARQGGTASTFAAVEPTAPATLSGVSAYA